MNATLQMQFYEGFYMRNQKRKLIVVFISIFLLVSACQSNRQTPNVTDNGPAVETVDATPGDVSPTITSPPDPNETASKYLDAWVVGDYVTMYNMLTRISIDSLSYQDFETRYKEVALQARLVEVNYKLQSKLVSPTSAQVGYDVTLISGLIEPIERTTSMDLSLTNGEWKIVWDDSIIMQDLAGGNYLSMETFTPTRGIIYDKDGSALAADAVAVAIEVIPSAIIDEEDGNGLLAQLATMTGLNIRYLDSIMFQEEPPFLISIAEIPLDQFNQRSAYLEPYLHALRFTEYNTRLSYVADGGAQTLGWVGSIPGNEVDDMMALGIPPDAQIGRKGVEAWAENYLAGVRGGNLYLVSPEGEIVTIIGSREREASQSVYTTLDDSLLEQGQFAFGDFIGAAVIMEVDTGKVLGIVSNPTFDPNDADFQNPNSEWGTSLISVTKPFLNRATQGVYPPGSIFKPITLAAALESGAYTRQSVINCTNEWEGLGAGIILKNWTLAKELPADGNLSLLQGLMRSCNPWFYEIGLALYERGDTTLVTDIAKGFGLGSATNIGVLPESEGQVNYPEDGAESVDQARFNSTQLAIGQGDTQITPIQAVSYAAAIANGGTLYQPQLIDKIEDTAGEFTFEFTPIINGTLPISQSTITAIQDGMRMVTEDPRGTAYRVFANQVIPVYGKTGTAESPPNDPHAWFIGYTNLDRADKPDIAIAVLVENIGDGSEFAAPIFKRLMEIYFYGSPQSPYRWENRIGELDPLYFLTDVEIEALGLDEN
jgi:cell division protein FtsI/penicillin-binding protein 2